MSVSCPNCGCEIVGLIVGTAPFPGLPPGANGGATTANAAQIPGANPGANDGTTVASEIAQGFRSSSTKDGRTAYNLGYPAEFLLFWGIYPRKRDKRKALKAWRNATRRASAQTIRDGAIRYRDDPNRLDEFTKYAEGWLNGDGWEDEPLPPRISTRRPPDPPRPMTSGEMDRAIKGEQW